MARRGLATWLSAGSLLVGLSTVVVSFMGCYGDVGTQSGKCVGEDDDNPCTVPTCSEGSTTAVHVAVPDDPPVECSRGENAGVCKKGLCELDCGLNCKCASDAECPPSTACVTWTCDENKECKRTDAEDMKPVDTAEPNDCKKTVCISGAPQLVNDENDTLADVLGDCKVPTCVNMMHSTMPKDDDLPAEIDGDCRKPACDMGNPTTDPDDTDEPMDTECIDNKCAGGVPTDDPAKTGTPCATGHCNLAGKCVDCFEKPDWGDCGGPDCPAKLCNGQVCGSMNDHCKSGACVDGVCCNEACSAECKACNVAGSVGTCTNMPKFAGDIYQVGGVPKECKNTNGFACDGNGTCKPSGGASCVENAGCLSGVCEMMMCTWQVGEFCDSPSECGAFTCVNGKCQ